MAQHVKLFNALSPSDKQDWDTMAADLSRKHVRNIEQECAARCGHDQLSQIEVSSRALA